MVLLGIVGVYRLKVATREHTSVPSTESILPFEVKSVDVEALKQYKLPIVIDFGAHTCVPCKEMAPVLERLNAEWQGKVIVQFVDVWKYKEVANAFPVQVIPTQIFYTSDGKPFVPSEQLIQEIDFMVYKHKVTNEHLFTVHQGGLTEDELRKIVREMGVE